MDQCNIIWIDLDAATSMLGKNAADDEQLNFYQLSGPKYLVTGTTTVSIGTVSLCTESRLDVMNKGAEHAYHEVSVSIGYGRAGEHRMPAAIAC
jgi:hypothetical protein